MREDFLSTLVTSRSRLLKLLCQFVAVIILCVLVLSFGSPAINAANLTSQLKPKTFNAQLECAIPSPDNHGYFGSQVSLSADGSRGAIEAYGTSLGAAYIYDRVGSNCNKTAEITDPVTSDTFNYFTGLVLSKDGHSLIVGINTGSVTSGIAYVFNDNGNTWSPSSLINPDQSNPNRFNFGSNVALSGDGNTALVQGEISGSNGNTYVYTFVNNGGNWTYVSRVSAPDGPSDLTFGKTMVLSYDGKSAFISSQYDNSKTGAVYAYTRNADNSWSQPNKITAQDGMANDRFGSGLALSNDGSTLAVGAYKKTVGSQTSAGAVYVFTSNGANWSQETELTASDAFLYAAFGDAVALNQDGSILLVGSSGNTVQDANGNYVVSGTAYVFVRNGATYIQQAELVPPIPSSQASYGGAVALSNDGATALIGSEGNEAAYFYGLSNGVGAPAQIAPTAGNNQTAALGQPFPVPFQVTVTDANGNPVPNVAVNFQAPVNGPGGTFAAPTAQPSKQNASKPTIKPLATTSVTVYTDSNGVATAPVFTANNTAGSYNVTASVNGLSTVAYFNLTNSSSGTSGSTYTYNLPLLANNANTALGRTTTYITLQNLSSTTTANININYYGLNDGSYLNLHDNLQLAPKGQKALLPGIPAGTSAGGVITSDQPLNLVVSEALNAGGSAYNVSGNTSSTLFSPLALNGQYGFTTSIVIFNASSNSSATGNILFFDEAGNAVSSATQSFSIPAYASKTFNQAASGSGLNANHAYWAKIVADSGSSSLSAQVIEFGPNNFVATFNAVVPGQVQKTLYAPATFNGQFSFVTGMALANPNTAQANLTLTYYSANGTRLLTQAQTIAPNGVIGVYQPAVSGLSNQVSSATITSDQPLIMTVNERGPGTISGTYVGLAGGSTNVALPVMANGFAGFVTGSTILNTSPTNQAATLTFTYLDANGNPIGTPQTKTLAANASFLVYQGGVDQSLPGGFFGTAVITSDQPLLVTTNALNTTTGLFYTYTEPSQ